MLTDQDIQKLTTHIIAEMKKTFVTKEQLDALGYDLFQIIHGLPTREERKTLGLPEEKIAEKIADAFFIGSPPRKN